MVQGNQQGADALAGVGERDAGLGLTQERPGDPVTAGVIEGADLSQGQLGLPRPPRGQQALAQAEQHTVAPGVAARGREGALLVLEEGQRRLRVARV